MLLKLYYSTTTSMVCWHFTMLKHTFLKCKRVEEVAADGIAQLVASLYSTDLRKELTSMSAISTVLGDQDVDVLNDSNVRLLEAVISYLQFGGCDESAASSALLTLSSVAMRGAACCEWMVAHGLFAALDHVLESHKDSRTIQDGVAMVMFSSVQDRATTLTSLAINAFVALSVHMLESAFDIDIASDVARTLRILCNRHGDTAITLIISSVLDNILLMLQTLLQQPEASSATSTIIRLLGTLSEGSAGQQRELMQHVTFLPVVCRALYRTDLASAALYTLASLFNGPEDVIDTVLGADVLPVVLQYITAADLEIKQEAVFTLLWLLRRGTPAHAKYAISCNCIQLIVLSLEPPCDEDHLRIALLCLKELLKLGRVMSSESTFSMAMWLQEAGAVHTLQRYLLIENDRIRSDVNYVLRSIADELATANDDDGIKVDDDDEDVLAALAGRIKLHE